MLSISKKEGVSKLWLGNGATIIRIAPYAAIQFTTYEQAKKVCPGKGEKVKLLISFRSGNEFHSKHELTSWYQVIIGDNPTHSKRTPFIHMLCGAIAGTVSTGTFKFL